MDINNSTARSAIGLRIGGTKQRRAGFAPLVSVGVLAGNEGENMDMSPTIKESPTYVLKHARDYILYMLVDRNVKSFDAATDGVLCIAVTIPSNMQFSTAAGPYRLLQEVYDAFRTMYMAPQQDGRYAFKDADADSEVFRHIVEGYPLENRKGPYVTMSPSGMTGTVRVPADKMELFFQDTQYEAFANYGLIEVGKECQSSYNLDNLPIPQGYRVIENNRDTGVILLRDEDVYETHQLSTEEVEFENYRFTLGELLNSPGAFLKQGKNEVRIHPQKRQILCTVAGVTKTFQIEVAYDESLSDSDRQFLAESIQRRNLKLVWGDGVVYIPGKELKARTIQTRVDISPRYYGGLDLSATSERSLSENKVIVRISGKKKIHTPPASYGSSPTRGTGADHPREKGNPSSRYELEEPLKKDKEKGVLMDWKAWLIPLLAAFLLGIALGVGGTLLAKHFFGKGKKVETEVSIKPVNDLSTDHNSFQNAGKDAAEMDPAADKQDVVTNETPPSPVDQKNAGSGDRDHVSRKNQLREAILRMIKAGDSFSTIEKSNAYKEYVRDYKPTLTERNAISNVSSYPDTDLNRRSFVRRKMEEGKRNITSWSDLINLNNRTDEFKSLFDNSVEH